MSKKHVIQVYLNDDEYRFITDCAAHLNKSLAQTLLHFADFRNRMKAYKEDDTPARLTVHGVNFSETPFEDSEEY